MKSLAAPLSKVPLTHLAFSKLKHVTAAAYLCANQHTLLAHIHTYIHWPKLTHTHTHTQSNTLKPIEYTVGLSFKRMPFVLCWNETQIHSPHTNNSGINTRCDVIQTLRTKTRAEFKSAQKTSLRFGVSTQGAGFVLYSTVALSSPELCWSVTDGVNPSPERSTRGL